ncbi:MAG: hypothetical protein H6925_01300 [Holosporaceae bacterium]|nr:MAG: hypothetical protein H6925_01300 [Holosporaceae bacterium]
MRISDKISYVSASAAPPPPPPEAPSFTMPTQDVKRKLQPTDNGEEQIRHVGLNVQQQQLPGLKMLHKETLYTPFSKGLEEGDK